MLEPVVTISLVIQKAFLDVVGRGLFISPIALVNSLFNSGITKSPTQTKLTQQAYPKIESS